MLLRKMVELHGFLGLLLSQHAVEAILNITLVMSSLNFYFCMLLDLNFFCFPLAFLK
uniref:Uncharacterized protein n=1 Tax=Anguilla anguilla TaxID=7936 RepID=A0A0E9WW59_ANGAN